MNNIRDINEENIVNDVGKTVRRQKKNLNARPDYLTDKALEELIATVEEESMLHPPKNFRDDILSQIYRKRKYKKNLQLFSYSMKVIAATAAALGIVLVVPDNISTQESQISGYVSEWQNNDWMQDVRKRSQNEGLREGKKTSQEKERNARSTKKSYDEQFIYKLNKQMDEYVSIVNGKLNQFVRMEVNFNEEEEK